MEPTKEFEHRVAALLRRTRLTLDDAGVARLPLLQRAGPRPSTRPKCNSIRPFGDFGERGDAASARVPPWPTAWLLSRLRFAAPSWRSLQKPPFFG